VQWIDLLGTTRAGVGVILYRHAAFPSEAMISSSCTLIWDDGNRTEQSRDERDDETVARDIWTERPPPLSGRAPHRDGGRVIHVNPQLASRKVPLELMLDRRTDPPRDFGGVHPLDGRQPQHVADEHDAEQLACDDARASLDMIDIERHSLLL
jgi:hypothetical protein